MSDPADTLLSVRGEARQVVPPDYVTMTATVEVTRGSKAEAVRTAAANTGSLTADLAARGGVALEAGTERRPLTWSAQSATTNPERSHDKKSGVFELTGRVTAVVDVIITVRAFDLLDPLGAALTGHEAVSVRHVSWDVDWDNPGWRDVRAAAIAAAIAKGRDYAAALGGSLRSVQHIADAGLLGGDNAATQFIARSPVGVAGRGAGGGGGESDPPSLDPVPQELTAVIEARLVAGGVSLTAP
jgi:uncharacterized protein YggE